nr:anaerobic C4-dicarboxylate transporter family protein [Salmonella enterica]
MSWRPLFTGLRRAGFTGEKILRRHPRYITLLAPFICYIFTFMSGTGHVVYSLLPVISEVARDSGIRPERPYLFPLSHRNRRSPPALYLPPWRR